MYYSVKCHCTTAHCVNLQEGTEMGFQNGTDSLATNFTGKKAVFEIDVSVLKLIFLFLLIYLLILNYDYFYK